MFKTGLEELTEKVAIAMTASSFSPMNALRGVGKSLRRGAVMAGVGGAGALALGAGMEHDRDKKRDHLVYSPTSGGFAT